MKIKQKKIYTLKNYKLQQMKKIKMYAAAIIYFFAALTVSSAEETLSNKSIVSLISAKLSNQLIINKIKGTPNNFDMSSAAIIDLKKQKVPDQVVDEMLQ